jgi:hypothetical protein
VPPHLAVLPAGAEAPAPVSARTLVFAQSPETAVVPLPDGQQRITHFHTSLVRVLGSSPGTPCRLFTEVGPARAPNPLWLTNLTDHTLAAAGSIAALHTGTMDAIGSMEQDFGLLDFEGRSFPGWYHHMALVSAAYTYRRLHETGSGHFRFDAQGDVRAP